MSLKLTEGHVPRAPNTGHDLAVVPPGLSTAHEVVWAVELEPGLDSLQILVEAIQVVLGLADLGLESELVLVTVVEKTLPRTSRSFSGMNFHAASMLPGSSWSDSNLKSLMP